MRSVSVLGAVACAGAVALAAYASHGLQGEDARRALLAAAMAFGHGLALLVLGPLAKSWLQRRALAALALGMVVFCGSLAANVLFGASTALAPAGGVTLIAGWLALAIAAYRQ
jgi:uncharacterized membrane protein YgdD (TMEM256/DUF423 family)